MTHDLAISVRRATTKDAAKLAELVNAAYAVEAFFVDGARTDAQEVAALVERGAFLVLEREGGFAAAVHVEVKAGAAHIGMVSVSPDFQGRGLGTRLVRIAEAMSEAVGCSSVHLRVVNLRDQLARWYRALGYREVGTAPYVDRKVKQPCHFVEMSKELAA